MSAPTASESIHAAGGFFLEFITANEQIFNQESETFVMNHETIAERLGESAFTRDLDPSRRAQVAQLTTPVLWEAGETIFREGDSVPYLYLIEHGSVSLDVSVKGRGKTTILTVGPGEVFGWSSIFEPRPKTASARATVPTRGFAIDAESLRARCDSDPVLGYAIARRLYHVLSERVKALRLQFLDVLGDDNQP